MLSSNSAGPSDASATIRPPVAQYIYIGDINPGYFSCARKRLCRMRWRRTFAGLGRVLPKIPRDGRIRQVFLRCARVYGAIVQWDLIVEAPWRRNRSSVASRKRFVCKKIITNIIKTNYRHRDIFSDRVHADPSKRNLADLIFIRPRG